LVHSALDAAGTGGGGSQGDTAVSGVRVWLAAGRTDMPRGIAVYDPEIG
jgi:hypothetical protein